MPSEPPGWIRIHGARHHNLRNLTLTLPRERLIVITGVSGSGKSSLAFDTLYAEGRRRYVESLSASARQYLEQLEKPDVDRIDGLSPAIAVEQREAVANPRATVATLTEIYDYLRLTFAAAGVPHDPETGRPLRRQTPGEIVDALLALPAGTRLQLLAPVVRRAKGSHEDAFERIRREGFTRARIDGEIVDLAAQAAPPKLAKSRPHSIELVIDRLVVRDDLRPRLADSIETTLRWGRGTALALRQATNDAPWEELAFSTDFRDPVTGYTRPAPTARHFNFNSPHGACPACHGLGTRLEPDPARIIPDPTLPLSEAIHPWSGAAARMQPFYDAQLRDLAAHYGAKTETPFERLPAALRTAVLHGSGDEVIGFRKTAAQPFDGLIAQLSARWAEATSEAVKSRLRKYLSPQPCPECRGARLNADSLAVTLSASDGRSLNLPGLCALTAGEVEEFLAYLQLDATPSVLVAEPLRQIRARLEFLREVGLEYVALNREAATLSGGEAQRVRLATQIGGGLSGVLYVLDEPSIGLHPRDHERLLGTLRRLRDLNNTVVVVEHDEDTMRAADHLVEIGPGAGADGGAIVAQGSLAALLDAPDSPTGAFLSGRRRLPRFERRLPGSDADWLTIRGAREHNLRGIDARLPLGSLSCVTGVSGSGKSTLVDDILRRALFRHFNGAMERPGAHDCVDGLEKLERAVVVDQAPIGRSPRSNPATFTGLFGPIRDLFAKLPSSRARGFSASRFSFNVAGGRCERCGGDGQIKVEMQFLPDVHVTCEACEGRRFNRETLEVTFKGRSIADVLALPIADAAAFFRAVPALGPKLDVLVEVGLGYLALGQSADTLSGGEAQRLKLGAELMKTAASGRAIYLLDEPTTGLHLADIERLLRVLFRLRDAGHTLVIVEHHPEFIACADWVLDLGPEAGAGGGLIVAEGPPEEIATRPGSHTGIALRRVLARP